jgi:ATP/maltotriose-dependent transcriptional regulator MalT
MLFLEPADRAEERYACARAAHERAGDRVGLLHLLTDRGGDLLLVGRYEEADRLLSSALALARELGDRLGEAEVDDARAAAALLRGDLARVRTHLDAARRGFATERAAFNSADTLATETWLALLTGSHEDAARWLAAFEERMASYGGAPVASAVLRAGIGFRFGDAGALLLSAKRALELVGAPERTSIVAVLMYATLAEHHALARACDEAVGALTQAARMARDLGAPRFVAHVALVAAILAEAQGDTELARDLLGHAASHPALEHERVASARALASRLGLAWPPGALAAAEDDDDLLGRVEAFLGGVGSSSP